MTAIRFLIVMTHLFLCSATFFYDVAYYGLIIGIATVVALALILFLPE